MKDLCCKKKYSEADSVKVTAFKFNHAIYSKFSVNERTSKMPALQARLSGINYAATPSEYPPGKRQGGRNLQGMPQDNSRSVQQYHAPRFQNAPRFN